jgi:hypothetical protein
LTERSPLTFLAARPTVRAPSRLLEKAHLRGTQPAAGYPACSGTRCGVLAVCLTRPRVPIRRMGAPPGIWTFLSSLSETGRSSILPEECTL